MKIERILGTSLCCNGKEALNQELFAAYRENGIGAYEFSVDAEIYSELDIPAITAAAKAEGIIPWSFHLPFYFFPATEIQTVSEEKRKKAVKFHSEQMKMAADLGYRHFVIHPSGEPLDGDRAVSLEHSRQSVYELAQVAKETGTVLCVEDLPRTCIGHNAEEILYLLSADPAVGVCFDTNHLTIEDPFIFLDKVGDRLKTIHVSDYDFIDERHWLPGQGRMDWNRLLDKLDEVGYTGVFMYEVNLTSNRTVLMDAPLTPADLAQNYRELTSRAPLTKKGVTLI